MEKYEFYFQTTKTNNIKKLFEVLKEIIQIDMTLIITPDSIKINKITEDKMNIVSLKLNCSEFEISHIPKKFFVKIYTKEIYIVIKTINNSDIVSFYILKDDPNYLYIESIDKSGDINSVTKISHLVDENYKEMNIKEISANSTTTLLCSKFNKICKDFNNFYSPYIIITDYKDRIEFKCNTDDFVQKVSIKQKITKEIKNFTPITGKFKLKSIMPFTKGVNLTDNENNIIKIYITKDSNEVVQLIIQYNIGSLGNIRLITSGIKINN